MLLNIDCKDGYIYLREENSTAENTDEQRKKDSHYGLEIIKSISEKYNGIFESKVKDNMFCISVSLKY